MNTFTNPVSDDTMVYNKQEKRYILTENYVRERGIDLSLILDTEHSPEPSKVPELFLDRISMLVYNNIYSYGRQREDKEYLLACNENLRPVIRDAMIERISYIYSSGDLSVKGGAIIEQGTRIETQDLIASPVEEDMLRSVGILHRGKYYIQKDETLEY